jgi:bifunctional non-homologous end joining protein LigD
MTAVATELRMGRRTVRVTNPDKVLYPEADFTKADVIAYYRQIAPVILKHLKGRPLTLKRYPNGTGEGFFYEKNCPAHKPDWVPTAKVKGSSGTTSYCLVDSAATLLWVANLASLELHTLLAKMPDTQRPTMMVFDLDPGPPAAMEDCLKLGLKLRDMFEHLGLKTFPKTSGGKGLHLYIPLNTPVTFDQTKSFASAIAKLLERDMPETVVSSMRKDLRTGRILVDWSQNDDHKTTVCAYSLRARALPTVSTPITWKEAEAALRAGDADRLVFTARDVLKRVAKFGDIFAPVLKMHQRLPQF